MAASSALKLRIEGMDCASCALKIETAMQRLPGVSDISVNYGQGTLSLLLDEDRTQTGAILERIRFLGYRPIAPEAVGGAGGSGPVAAGGWWATGKGRLVLGTGALLALAFVMARILPGDPVWPYAGAALAGLLPIARRAWAGARTGTPFGIETLMTVATLGALAIGATGEAAVVVVLFALGELLEGISATRARAGIAALVDLVPRTAHRITGEAVETVPAGGPGGGRHGDDPARRPRALGRRRRRGDVRGQRGPGHRRNPCRSPRRPGPRSMPAASTATARCAPGSAGRRRTIPSPGSSIWWKPRRRPRRRRRGSSTGSAAGIPRPRWRLRRWWCCCRRC